MLPFKLNMELLNDAFSDAFHHVKLFSSPDPAHLESVRFWQEGQEFLSRYIYILSSENLRLLPPDLKNICLIVSGNIKTDDIPADCSVLVVEDDVPLPQLLTLAQDTFEKYNRWNQEIHSAISNEHPLDDMLKASLPLFRNPVFIHDTNFYILSCPHRAPKMMVWEEDKRTGWQIVPLALIHDFKADPEYLNTLTTTEASLYSAEQRGYPILYINLWNNGRYEGRICVDELETPIRPGQYHVITHLAKLITSFMNNKNLLQLDMGNDTEQFFRKYLNGTLEDQSIVMNMLHFLNWKRNDHYHCLRLETDQQNIRMLSSAATIGHIEMLIPDGHAFIHRNGITVIVNLSISGARISDVLSSLAILLREGLLKMGVSSEIHDFLLLPQGFYQARLALILGRKSTSMNWCYRFDDYILEFLLHKGGETLSPELLCSNKILLLRQYDAENHTELYQTLKIYLNLERNVLQTAKSLFIHRSTLFYRLERIRKIADIDFENEKERLILQLSFYILEQSE